MDYSRHDDIFDISKQIEKTDKKNSRDNENVRGDHEMKMTINDDFTDDTSV